MFMYTDYTQHLLDNVKKIHFIGCGGSGMYPLIQILSAKGYDISVQVPSVLPKHWKKVTVTGVGPEKKTFERIRE